MTDTPTRRSGRLRELAAVQTVFGMDEMLMMIFQHVDNVTVVTVLPFVSKQWNRVAATIACPVKLFFTLSMESSAPSTFEWNDYRDSSALHITSPRIDAFEKAASKVLVVELNVAFGRVVEQLLNGAWLFPHIRSLSFGTYFTTCSGERHNDSDESNAILRLFSNVLPGLTSLTVDDSEGGGDYPSDHTLAQYIKACPNLDPSAVWCKVYHGCDGEVDHSKGYEFCEAIAEHRKEITSLSLRDCRLGNIDCGDVLLIAESCSHVTNVDLSGEIGAVLFDSDEDVEAMVKAWSVK